MNFLTIIKNSFLKCLETHERSNEKLKILHGAIARDINNKLGHDYDICSLGFSDNKEEHIEGRYINKKVDITIKKQNEVVAGIAVKFVMSNYSQNSNNYFENMLGETANIRANNIPYFQIFILFQKMPYFDKDVTIKKWEEIGEHYIKKYVLLSQDNIDKYQHTSDKILLCLLDITRDENIENKQDYKDYYLHNDFNIDFSVTEYDFGNNVIYNNYDLFIDKIYHKILSI
jgi:hypothetical protein